MTLCKEVISAVFNQSVWYEANDTLTSVKIPLCYINQRRYD